MKTRMRSGGWRGKKLDGNETFFVDLRNSFTPVIGGDVTVTRSGATAHVFDHQGNLVNVAANEGRILGARHLTPDWSRFHAEGQPINPGTAKGAIVEQASTNSIQYFDNIDNGWWTRNLINATSGTGTSIAGRAAKGLIGDTNNNSHSVGKAFTVNASGIFVLSGLFAKGNNDFIFLRSLNLVTFETVTAWFNLSTGAVATAAGVGAMTLLDTRIEKVNGGYWCSMAAKNAGASAQSCMMVYASASADNIPTFAGDDATVNTWMSALQLNLNIADTVFPPLPVLDAEGAVSIKPNDIIEFDNTHYSTTGSVVGEFYLPDAPTIGSDPISIFTFQKFDQDTDDSLRVHLHPGTGTLQFAMWPGPSVTNGTMISTASALTKGRWYRFAVGWDKADDGTSAVLSFYVNGVKETTVFGGFNGYVVPAGTTMDKFYLGSRSSNSGGSHHDQFAHFPISFLKKYDVRLTDAELKARSL